MNKFVLACVIGVFGFLVTGGFYSLRVSSESRAKEIQSLQEELKAVKNRMVSTNLALEEQARLLTLQEHLYQESDGKLGARLPYIAATILEMEKTYRPNGMTASLILAVIEVESTYNPKAVSSSGALGLMQIMQSTANPILEDLDLPQTPDVLLDPEVSIRVGTQYLVDMHTLWMGRGKEDVHEWHLSIMTYFWGERWVGEMISGKSADRVDFPGMAYWSKVKDAQQRWKQRGF